MGLTAYIGHREKEKTAAKANRNTAAMQAEIDRRTIAAQQRQMMEMQQMGQQMAMPQSVYGTPTVVGTPQGYPPAFAYSTPGQMQQMYQAPQGFFPQQAVSPGMPQGMPGGWGSPGPQPMQGQYFVQQPQMQPQHQAAHQPYGASFDQAQAAARYAHQQGQQGQRRS